MTIISNQGLSIIDNSIVTFASGTTVKVFKDTASQFYVNTEGLSSILGLTVLNLKEKYSIKKEYHQVTEVVMFAYQEYLNGNSLAWKNLADQFFTSAIIEKVFKGEVEIVEEKISYDQWTKEVLKDIKPLPDKVSYRLSEKNVQDKLSKRFSFIKEVSTPIGRIDLLGHDILCEIKTSSQWKHGLGQLCGYSQYYPTHKLYLCLFDISASTDIATIKKICKEFEIVVVDERFNLL